MSIPPVSTRRSRPNGDSPSTLAGRMIDLHCHLLPGVDDGPSDMAGSVAMARAHVDAGVTTVACTPHVDWEMPNDAGAIGFAVEALRTALKEADVPLQIVAAAEVGLTRAAELPDEELGRLTFAGGRWLLLEAPLRGEVGVEQAVNFVAMRGHRILLAHPERSPAFQRDIPALRRLVDGGVLCQVTATALTGQFGSTVQRCARTLMAEGLVHVIASDAHDTRRRPPGLSEHVVEAGFGAQTEYLTDIVPAAILSGGPIPARPTQAPATRLRRRRWLRRA
jgi:protein-tyrosine phosphatase